MRAKYFQILSLVITTAGFAFVTFLYWTEPRTLAEVTTKGTVVLGTYAIDQDEFRRGLESFKREDFAAARAAFDRADPEKRNAAVQFYTAYSFYRQGWGRFSNDDALFQSGIAAVNRAIALDPNLRVADETLVMKTPLDLKTELEEGLKITTSDFNPLKLTRERK